MAMIQDTKNNNFLKVVFIISKVKNEVYKIQV